MIEVTLLNEVTQVSDIMGSTSIAIDSRGAGVGGGGGWSWVGVGGVGHSLYESYYICSAISNPLFQVSGKFV